MSEYASLILTDPPALTHAPQGDAENLPFDDQTFDIVACRFAMHQFPYPEDVLEEMMRVCKKDGKVVCFHSPI